jgi:DNA-binding transcriptional ArsR family regulator
MMYPLRYENFSDLYGQLFNAKDVSAFGRLIYSALLVKSIKEASLELVVPAKAIAVATGLSQQSVNRHLRLLEKTGLVRITDRSRFGFHVLLTNLESIIATLADKIGSNGLDIEAIDFYSARRYVDILLARQGGRCIYTLRGLKPENTQLDHLKPVSRGGDNSYRNIVACTFEANTRKGDKDPIEFLRQVFREGIISEEEFKAQVELLKQISSGELKPDLVGSG